MYEYLRLKYNGTRYLPVAYLEYELQLNSLQFDVLKHEIFEDLRNNEKILPFDYYVKIVDKYLDENRCQEL